MKPVTDAELDLPLGPALDFLRLLWEVNHAMESFSNHMERTLGVTAQQRLVIRCVGRYPGLTPGQLARLLHLDPGTISAALGRLERRGLVVRRRDERDQRRVTVGLTARGRTMDRPSPQTVEAAVERLLATERPSNVAAAARVLRALTDALSRDQSPARRGSRVAKRVRAA